jgi:hypothetical protein
MLALAVVHGGNKLIEIQFWKLHRLRALDFAHVLVELLGVQDLSGI